MKVYIGIDMAKDKFDYCAMNDTLNILCRGSNKENKNERFRELSDLIRTLKSTSTMMKIGMESTGIYHIPLYNHLRAYGFSVRILNGLEVRGMKKSRVRKTTNDTIDAESIARYLMIREEKETFVFPENLREIITAYSIVTDKIITLMRPTIELEHYKDTYIEKREQIGLYRGRVKGGGNFNLLLNSLEVHT